MYKINTRVFAEDDTGKYPGTITDIMDELYKVEYDGGGYDWLLADEIEPLEYKVGDYVQSPAGFGKVIAVNQYFFGIITVSFGKGRKTAGYYENQLRPAKKPKLVQRLLGKQYA